MSVKLSSWVWDGCAAQGVKGIKLLVMARLADFSSDEGVCWPSVETIARQLGAGRSSVITAITNLEKEGWLTRTERRNGQRSGTNLYTLNAEKLRAAAAEFQGSDSERSKSGRPSNKGPAKPDDSDSERSGSEHSDSERSENAEKRGSQGSESGHDPSVTTDPPINPTHNAQAEQVLPVDVRPAPDYAGQPGAFFPAAEPFGKIPMTAEWVPSADFRQRAAYWGSPVPDVLDVKNLKAALASFTDYWISESKFFSQTQWEQKFARHLQNIKPIQPRGNPHAGLDPNSTANAAVQRAQAARAAQLRARGQSVEVLGTHAGNLLEPLGGQERFGSVGPMDCAD